MTPTINSSKFYPMADQNFAPYSARIQRAGHKLYVVTYPSWNIGTPG